MKKAFRLASAIVLLTAGVVLEYWSFRFHSLQAGAEVYKFIFAVGADVCLIAVGLLFQWKRQWILLLLAIPLMWTLHALFDAYLIDWGISLDRLDRLVLLQPSNRVGA